MKFSKLKKTRFNYCINFLFKIMTIKKRIQKIIVVSFGPIFYTDIYS